MSTDTAAPLPPISTLIRPDCCAKCKFAMLPKLNEPLECRRYPPVPTTFMVPGRNGATTFPTHTGYPRVSGDHWCGEFKMKLVIAN